MQNMLNEIFEYIENKDKELKIKCEQYDGNESEGKYLCGQISVMKELIQIINKNAQIDK